MELYILCPSFPEGKRKIKCMSTSVKNKKQEIKFYLDVLLFLLVCYKCIFVTMGFENSRKNADFTRGCLRTYLRAQQFYSTAIEFYQLLKSTDMVGKICLRHDRDSFVEARDKRICKITDNKNAIFKHFRFDSLNSLFSNYEKKYLSLV